MSVFRYRKHINLRHWYFIECSPRHIHENHGEFLGGLTFLIGNFSIPIHTFVFIFSYLTKNSYGGFSYKFLLSLMVSDSRNVILSDYFIFFGWLGNCYAVVTYDYLSGKIIKENHEFPQKFLNSSSKYGIYIRFKNGYHS